MQTSVSLIKKNKYTKAKHAKEQTTDKGKNLTKLF